jgi:hypothetical protein
MKQIRMMIPNEQIFKVEVYEDSVCFSIYEVEVPIIYKNKLVYIDCEIYEYRISPSMMKELNAIMDFIKENSGEIDELLRVGDV